MKFLIDAQLPRRFCSWLAAAGHDAIHTLDLPERNHTADSAILDIAEREARTGNIGNSELEKLIRDILPSTITAFETDHFIELGRESMMVHE